MIGFNILMSRSSDYELKELSCLKKEAWHYVNKLFENNGLNYTIGVLASQYDGYPINSWSEDGCFFLVEGIIYNQSEDWIKASLTEISKDYDKSLLSAFVKDTDGDYVICIVNKGKILIFNDELGGLPFNYAISENRFVAGRNLSWVAKEGGAELSKKNIAELLCFNYNMAGRTIFENIKSMKPAMFIECKEVEGQLEFSKGDSVERCYELKQPFKTKKEAILVLRDLFLKGCKTRCDYAKENGYEIVNTMSGGYDSRTVLGGIEACIASDEYKNLTYEYKQDESIVATKVLEALGSKSEYIKLSYENVPNYYDSELSYKTEGKIATYINSICYNDLKYSYDHCFNGKRLLYFGGFGGEFIRHPLFSNIWRASNIGDKMSPSLKEVSLLIGIDYKITKQLIESTFSSTSSSESFCKMFYDEYYRNYVRGAGEERIRMFYFSVQPLMSKEFILTIRNRVPLKWVGYEFYTDFLRAINPALVSVELFSKRPNIFSKSSLKRSDFRNQSILYNVLRYIKGQFSKPLKKIYVDGLERTNSFELILDKEFFNNHFDEYSLHTQCKIASVLYYLDEFLYKKQ